MAQQTVYFPFDNHFSDIRGEVFAEVVNSNGVSFTTGLVNNAADLSGSSQKLTSSNAFFHGLTGFDFEMVGWIRIDVTGQNHGLFGQTTSSYHCHVIGTNKVRWRVNTSAGAVVLDSTETLSADTWYRVRVGYDHSEEDLFLQIDNGTVQTTTTNGNAIQTGVQDFSWGSIATSNYMNGRQELFMMRREGLFTTDELNDHYNSGSGAEFDSELVLDYTSAAGAKRVKVTAKAAQIGGSGTQDCQGLYIDQDSLPDELHDSDETATVEASGAGSLRFSTDEAGTNMIPLRVLNFTPASGGGTARCRLNNNSTLDGTSGTDVYAWWLPSGHSKSQPPAGHVYGAEAVEEGSYWPLEEDPGGTAPQMIDLSSNGNDGTTAGLVSGDSVSGQVGNGVQFSSADYIEISDDDSLSFDSAFTISLAFEMDASISGYRTIISKRDNALSPPADWGINLNQDLDVFQVFFHDGTNYHTHAIDLATNFSANTWYRVDFTCEESGSDVVTKIYKDGVLLDTETFTGTSLGNSTARLRIGATRYSGTDGEHFAGTIDEVSVQSGALSADQITTLYNNQNDPGTFWDSTAAVTTPGAAAAVTSIVAFDAGLTFAAIAQKNALAVTAHDSGAEASNTAQKNALASISHDAGLTQSALAAKAALALIGYDAGLEYSNTGQKDASAQTGVLAHAAGFTYSNTAQKNALASISHAAGLTSAAQASKAASALIAHAAGFTYAAISGNPNLIPVCLALSIEHINKLTLSIEKS